MATYSITTTAKQDTVLSYVAGKRSVTVQAYMDASMMKILRQALQEFEADDAARVGAAYNAATNNQQAQVRTVLGL